VPVIAFGLDGRAVEVPDDGGSLLDALREHLGCRPVKDGCSPQGQCGCCTVWVDGGPRVSCVTPARRVAGRQVTTTDGLPEVTREAWSGAFAAAGASQCGFCTPGIVMRLAALESRADVPGRTVDEGAVRTALLAHLCRCTGWQTVVEAAGHVLGVPTGPPAAGDGPVVSPGSDRATPGPGARDPLLAAWRAQIEGSGFQSSGPDTVLGGGGFADDTAPRGALVAVPGPDGRLVVAGGLTEARGRSGKVQGRNSTVPLTYPLEMPEGDWALTLRTTWVEPAYLEPDTSWCRPGGRPATPLANGGAFGGKQHSPVPEQARRLAVEHDRDVRVLWPREEVVRQGPKRPPVAVGIRADGTGVLRVARGMAGWAGPGSGDPGPPSARAVLADRVAAVASGLVVEEVEVAGPPTSPDLRGAGWVEASVMVAALAARLEGRGGPGTAIEITAPSGGRARVAVAASGAVSVEVWAGEVLDQATLRSYCIGAVHQALGWVRSEGIAVDADGRVHDLTIRSFGILSARDTPWMDVTMHRSDRWPVNGSDAVFAATAAAAWAADGWPSEWPTHRGAAGSRPSGPSARPGPMGVPGAVDR
jgi:xanthine dehydrogenase small subunit